AGSRRFGFCFGQLFLDLFQQPRILRQPEDVVDSLPFAPCHDGVPAESGITAHDDMHTPPLLPYLSHNPLEVFQCSFGWIDLRASQLSTEQKLSAEDVQRQITIAVVVAVEEPAFLMPMYWIIGGIHIQRDRTRRTVMRIQKVID